MRVVVDTNIVFSALLNTNQCRLVKDFIFIINIL
jgi:predicted nucleic acid-binding protein